jgi:subtilase family serine protease
MFQTINIGKEAFSLLRFDAPGHRLRRTTTIVAIFAFMLLVSVAPSLTVRAAPPLPTAQASPFKSFSAKGPAPQSLLVLVTLALPLRNLGALDTLVAQVSDPSSPQYRHFLTPAQAKQEFLPTDAYDSLLRYVESSGFTVETTALDSVIVAQGTVGQVESAFHSGVSLFSNGSSSYYVSTGAATFDGAYVYASNASRLFIRPALANHGSSGGNVTFTSSAFPLKDLQPVYNATSLYSQGYTGAGETIGVLDFYGSPTISEDLQRFNSIFGFPETSLSVIPVGPYDPNLGGALGWSTEISLDVEASHAMAPDAAIDLYAANGALSLAVPLATIVQDDKVTTLSQSFGVPEWYYSQSYYLGGASFFAENAVLPDQLYALGSAEGITFLASSGDAGGGGYSAGPEGSLEYPASSPFVTSVGGTQTYFAGTLFGGQTFEQTAWSNIGYVPNGVNAGGGGGGVSILEPKPWYQMSQPTPPSFPNGRLNPDLSLQAGVDPATVIVSSGELIVGGTSESSPLLAGLLALVAQSAQGHLGLVNPFLYQVGNSPTEYPKGFDPISRGYIIPWTPSYGYNLATGWGAPNAGELARLVQAETSASGLSITGEILSANGTTPFEFTPGQVIGLQIMASLGTAQVQTGTFSASLQSLGGDTAPTPLTYDASTGNWTGSITVGNQSGIAYIYVSGNSGGATGNALGTIFAGYLGSVFAPDYAYIVPTDPWTWSPGDQLRVGVQSTDLNGDPAPTSSVTMTLDSYTLRPNAYSEDYAVSLPKQTQGIYQGNLSTPVPVGPITMVLGGSTYGYAPAVYGEYLQTTYIYPEVAAEPGSVAPGQYLTVIADPIAPVNEYFRTAYETGGTVGSAVSVGANVTLTLLDPTGAAVQTASLTYQPCAQALRVCNGGASFIYGQLQVPSGATAGLYTVDLSSSFDSLSLASGLKGSFYGQVMVSGGHSTPSISLSSPTLYEGQSTGVKASIAYPNGTEVKYGEYSAVVYPASQAGSYTTIMHAAYAAGDLVPLAYDPRLDLWVGNLTLASPTSSGSVSGLSAQGTPSEGNFDVFVAGLSFDGTPTSTGISAELSFYVQPYLLTTGDAPASGQTSGLAFDGVISSRASLSGDVFLDMTQVKGTSLTIMSSQILGTLELTGSNVTLVGVTGGSIVAYHSAVTLKDSSMQSIQLVNSTISLSASSYGAIDPALASVTILAPAQGQVFSGNQAKVNVSGDHVSSVRVTVDGKALAALPGGEPLYDVSLGSLGLSDGVHTLTVTAEQSDGLSASSTVSFATEGSLRYQLNLELAAISIVAAVALLIAIVSLVRGRRKQSPVPDSPPSQSPPAMQPEGAPRQQPDVPPASPPSGALTQAENPQLA